MNYYHVSNLAPAEEFLKATVADLFKLRESVWFSQEIRDKLTPEQVEKIKASKRRFRGQILGCIGALRLVRDASKAKENEDTSRSYNAFQLLAALMANARGWVPEVETIYGPSWDDFHVDSGDVGIALSLPRGHWKRAGGRP